MSTNSAHLAQPVNPAHASTHRKAQLVEVSSLNAIEGYDEKRAKWLADKIVSDGVWTMPLKVEKSKHLVMDGHHRFAVARALGLTRVPAEIYTYDEVEVYSLHRNIPVTAEIILDNHARGEIFGYKTTKHNFPDIDESFAGIALDKLR